jgi:hypothetical protein
MIELKPLSRDAIPAALEKAMRYRLLNEPGDCESICHDVLRIDADNQEAIVTLLLAITDRFSKGYAVGPARAQEIVARLHSPYERAYYSGLVAERRAKALLAQNLPGGASDAHDMLVEAMNWFEKAEAIRPPQNDDALLRWNACARIINANRLEARVMESATVMLE